MGNKTAILLFINGMLLFILVFICSDIYNSPISFLESTIVISENTAIPNNFWIKALHANNILFALTLILAMGYMKVTIQKWDDLDFYNPKIMKKLNLVGAIFIFQGGITTLLNFFINGKDFMQIAPISQLNISYYEGFLILTIGLFFFLITAILRKAKQLKDENDLTV